MFCRVGGCLKAYSDRRRACWCDGMREAIAVILASLLQRGCMSWMGITSAL